MVQDLADGDAIGNVVQPTAASNVVVPSRVTVIRGLHDDDSQQCEIRRLLPRKHVEAAAVDDHRAHTAVRQDALAALRRRGKIDGNIRSACSS